MQKSITSTQGYNLAKMTSLLATKVSEFTTKLAQEEQENNKSSFQLLRENSSLSNINLYFPSRFPRTDRGGSPPSLSFVLSNTNCTSVTKKMQESIHMYTKMPKSPNMSMVMNLPYK